MTEEHQIQRLKAAAVLSGVISIFDAHDDDEFALNEVMARRTGDVTLGSPSPMPVDSSSRQQVQYSEGHAYRLEEDENYSTVHRQKRVLVQLIERLEWLSAYLSADMSNVTKNAKQKLNALGASLDLFPYITCSRLEVAQHWTQARQSINKLKSFIEQDVVAEGRYDIRVLGDIGKQVLNSKTLAEFQHAFECLDCNAAAGRTDERYALIKDKLTDEQGKYFELLYSRPGQYVTEHEVNVELQQGSRTDLDGFPRMFKRISKLIAKHDLLIEARRACKAKKISRAWVLKDLRNK